MFYSCLCTKFGNSLLFGWKWNNLHLYHCPIFIHSSQLLPFSFDMLLDHGIYPRQKLHQFFKINVLPEMQGAYGPNWQDTTQFLISVCFNIFTQLYLCLRIWHIHHPIILLSGLQDVETPTLNFFTEQHHVELYQLSCFVIFLRCSSCLVSWSAGRTVIFTVDSLFLIPVKILSLWCHGYLPVLLYIFWFSWWSSIYFAQCVDQVHFQVHKMLSDTVLGLIFLKTLKLPLEN